MSTEDDCIQKPKPWLNGKYCCDRIQAGCSEEQAFSVRLSPGVPLWKALPVAITTSFLVPGGLLGVELAAEQVWRCNCPQAWICKP